MGNSVIGIVKLALDCGDEGFNPISLAHVGLDPNSFHAELIADFSGNLDDPLRIPGAERQMHTLVGEATGNG